MAVVIGVSDGGKTFRITEMNWEGAFKVNERTLKMTDGYSFIHDKGVKINEAKKLLCLLL